MGNSAPAKSFLIRERLKGLTSAECLKIAERKMGEAVGDRRHGKELDWDAKATEAARLMPAGKEKSEALKRAGLLRKAADIHKPFPAKKRGRPPKHT